MGLIKRAFQWDTAFSHDIIRGQLSGGWTGGFACWRQCCVGVSVRETDRQTDGHKEGGGASFTLVEVCCVSDVVNFYWLIHQKAHREVHMGPSVRSVCDYYHYTCQH